MEYQKNQYDLHYEECVFKPVSNTYEYAIYFLTTFYYITLPANNKYRIVSDQYQFVSSVSDRISIG